jgi:hypothetical protein
LVVNLDELNFGELFEVKRQRARNGVKCSVRLAGTCEVYVRDTIGKFKPVIAREAIENERKILIALHVTGTFEKFVQDSANKVL